MAKCSNYQNEDCPAMYPFGCFSCHLNIQTLFPPALEPEPDRGVEITYVAGPMTGYRDWNKPAFAGMTARLRTAGMVVINPDELHKADAETPWDYYLRRDLAELVKCQRVVLLPGWANSKGATLEHHVAKSLEMEIVYPEHFEEWFKNVR